MTLALPFVAEAAVSRYRIVKPGSSGGVITAAAATDKLLGTSDEISTAIGDVVDVAVSPYPWVTLGGTVAAGDWLTSDSQGRAIATTTTGNQVIGRAAKAGVVGDEINYISAPGQL